MSKRVAVLLFLAAIGCSNRTSDQSGDTTSVDESRISETGPWVVRADFTDRAQLAKLAAEHAPWEVHHKEHYAIIEVQNQAEFDAIEATPGCASPSTRR